MTRVMLLALSVATVGATGCGTGHPRQVVAAVETTSAPADPNPGSPAPQADPNRPATGPTVRFLGRFDASDPNQGLTFAWSASTIFTRFMGTGLDIVLSDVKANQYPINSGTYVNNWYDVWVDGEKLTPFTVSLDANPNNVVQNLPLGDHYVRISKRTEAQINVASFNGFVPLPTGTATLLPAPLSRSRRIEFIGDSITAGYGADGNVPAAYGNDSCTFTTQTENADSTFASMVADAFGAEYHAIAYSGKGIAQNDDCTGDPYYTMPVLYPNIIPLSNQADYDFSSWTPQAVVINLGTNDYNLDHGCAAPSDANFIGAWVSLFTTVRHNYPDAAIFCGVGPELSNVSTTSPPYALNVAEANIRSAIDMANQAGDANIFYVDLPVDTGANGYGCGGHPSQATHRLLAQVVIEAIHGQLGW